LQNHQLQQATVRATKCSRGIEESSNNVSHVCKYLTDVIIMTHLFYCLEKISIPRVYVQFTRSAIVGHSTFYVAKLSCLIVII